MITFKVGDIIKPKPYLEERWKNQPDYVEIRRQITKVFRNNHYEWKYVDGSGNTYLSSNSSDPHLESWELIL